LRIAVYALAVPQPLPRAFRRQLQAEDAAKVARIVAAVDKAPDAKPANGANGGDPRRLRGLPVVGVASGTSPGTDPVRTLLAKEHRRRT
jgi:hypothetical protein